jgi:uncharacterized protein with HEPN domain
MQQENHRESTETYLLTLTSRLSTVKSVVVVVAEADGRFTNHQANFDEVPWATVAGNLAAVEHDILNNKLVWEAVQVDGSDSTDE